MDHQPQYTADTVDSFQRSETHRPNQQQRHVVTPSSPVLPLAGGRRAHGVAQWLLRYVFWTDEIVRSGWSRTLRSSDDERGLLSRGASRGTPPWSGPAGLFHLRMAEVWTVRWGSDGCSGIGSSLSADLSPTHAVGEYFQSANASPSLSPWPQKECALTKLISYSCKGSFFYWKSIILLLGSSLSLLFGGRPLLAIVLWPPTYRRRRYLGGNAESWRRSAAIVDDLSPCARWPFLSFHVGFFGALGCWKIWSFLVSSLRFLWLARESPACAFLLASKSQC